MRRSNRAVRRIFILALAAMVLIVGSVFFVSIAKVHLRSETDLSTYADSANTVTEVTKALRGNLYDAEGNVIAQDVRTYNIVCILDSSRPSLEGTVAYVKDKENTARILSEVLKTDYDSIYAYLTQDVYQTELGTAGRNLSRDVKETIDSYQLPGIEFTDSIQRVYPEGTFASNLIGFAQTDENGSTVGKMGLELYLDSYLSGTDGTRTYQADKNGYILPGMKETVTSAINGDNVTLTINASLQETLEQAFLVTADRFQAYRVWGAVMEISTGKILAWGQSPSFDPNTLDITDYNNYGAQLPYEPGSTLKTFTWAAAINEGVYDGTAEVYGGPYCYTADAFNNPVRATGSSFGCLNNASNINYGMTTYDYGLVVSSNTVAAAIQNELITPDIHLEYLKKFGFFQSVNTDGLPEETGVLQFTWPMEKLALAYGQGSTVTMLQMIQAYSAVFGDGTMKRPYVVETIRDPYDSNNVIYQAQTKITGTPITAETAKTLQGILTQVAYNDNGTARHYQIPECTIMGKTGTTQVAVNGSYLSGTTIASTMLGLPAENPQYLVYYCFEAPYNISAHYYVDEVKMLLRKVAMLYNLSTTEEQPTENAEGEVPQEIPTTITTQPMPNLINHTLEYVNSKLDGYGVIPIILGEGPTVIDQYPSNISTVTTGQRVFLLTDTNSFVMPDMTGWTRKDVSALWAVTGFGFKLTGEGKVTSQSIPAGTTVTRDAEIEVVFE